MAMMAITTRISIKVKAHARLRCRGLLVIGCSKGQREQRADPELPNADCGMRNGRFDKRLADGAGDTGGVKY